MTYWHCPGCGFVKAKRCPYRGHSSYPVSAAEVFADADPGVDWAGHRRRQWRESKRRLRGSAKANSRVLLCANPDCESPFLPARHGQRYCRDVCRDRAKYLRRRGGVSGGEDLAALRRASR